MKNTLKKLLSLFLVLTMTIGIAPLSGFVGLKFPEINLPEWDLFDFGVKAEAEETVYSGSCGDSAYWSLNTKTGVLDITGTGTMYYTSSDAPWSSYADSIKKVKIAEEITSVGDSAFEDCTSLTSITIPDSVTTIGYSAFEGCTGITSVKIGNSVTSIGDWAFDNCTSLSSVYYTGDIESWCNISFGSADANPMYYAAKFYTYSDYYNSSFIVKDIIIPETVTEIKDYAFYDFENITSIKIGNNVTRIGNSAFWHCANITSIVIPESVKIIDDLAFNGCEKLASITIPDSVVSMGSLAFFYTAYFNDLNNWENNVLYIGNHLIQAIDILSGYYIVRPGTKTIAGNAFYECTSLTSVTIPDGVTTIGDGAFAGCTSLASITIPDSVISMGAGAFYNTAYYNNLDNWVNNVLYIDNHLIRANYILSGSYEIKSGTKTIAPNAFNECEGLKSIIIPNSVITIGESAFYACVSLTSINIPDSVLSIGDHAFEYCYSLTSINIPGSVESIGDSTFANCQNLTSVTISDGVKTIGEYAFGMSCEKLTSITIPDSVTSIGDFAFYPCVNLSSLVIGDGVVKIGDYAFYGSLKLTSITIGESVAEIGLVAFFNMSSYVDIYYMGDIASWCNISFSDFYSNPVFNEEGSIRNFYINDTLVKKLVIPDTVTKIKDYTFVGFRDITSVTIPDSVKSIDVGCFSYCTSLKSVTIPDSVKSIGEGAFVYCENIIEITIGNSVINIDDYAFAGCTSLTDVYYNGTEEDWNEIKIGSYNEDLLNATIHFIDLCEHEYISEVTKEPTCIDKGEAIYKCIHCNKTYTKTISASDDKHNYSVYEEVLSTCLKQGYVTYKCSYCNDTYKETKPLSNHTAGEWEIVTDATTETEGEKVKKCTVCGTVLETVVIPTISVLTGYCGENVTWELNLETGVLTISGEGDMYDYEYGTPHAPWYSHRGYINTVDIENGVVSIGEYAFKDCYDLTSVTIGNGVTNIGNSAFDYCDDLNSITIGSGVISIESAFYKCTSLTDVYYTGDIESWCSISFDDGYSNPLVFANDFYINDTLVNDVVIPDTVSEVKKYTFYGYKGLSSLVIEGNVVSIDYSAFCECENLTSVIIDSGVEKISAWAFYNCINLSSITIPDSVTSIGEGAFGNTAYYNNSVNWDNNVLYIDNCLIEAKEALSGSYEIKTGTKLIADNAFQYCQRLTSIMIPSGIINIGDYAFAACEGLTSVEIPYGVTSIGKRVFSHCYSLTSVTIPDSVTCIDYRGFYACKSLTSVVIPDSVTGIGEEAFASSYNLVSITIGNGVTSIGNSAFAYCESLTSVTIGNSVESIGDYVFYYCESLALVTIPNSVKNIGIYAFRNTAYYNNSVNWDNDVLYIDNCLIEAKDTLSGSYIVKSGTKIIADSAFDYNHNITSITVPDSVTNIGDEALYYCSSLTSINVDESNKYYSSDEYGVLFNKNKTTLICCPSGESGDYIIPNSVTSIVENAFAYCKNLASVTIGERVTSIDERAFLTCTGITSINVDIDNEYYSSDEYGVLFDKDKTKLIRCPWGKTGDYVIPDGVTIISDFAFSDCINITSIIIPDSVTCIGERTFSFCKGLISVAISDSITNISSYAFYSCYNLTDVYYAGTENDWDEIEIGEENECLSNATIHYETIICAHKPTKAIEENRVEPDCITEGSYDSVVYCSKCNTELSRETKSIPVTSHKWSAWEVTAEPTMTEKGEKVRTCSVCNGTEEEDIPATGITVTVTDANGKVIEEKIIEGDLTEISFGNIADGEYTVSVSQATYTSRNYLVSSTNGKLSLGFKLSKKGDVTGDNKLNTIDVARANSHAKGVSTLTDYSLACADVTGDGKVNTIDVARINSHAKGVSHLW